MKNRLTKVLLIILSVIVAIVITISVIFFVSILPVSKRENKVVFRIPDGTPSRKVFELLKNRGYIKNDDFAFMYSKIFTKSDFKAGEFTIDTSWPLKDLIEYMSDTNNIVEITTDFTIYPGSTVRMIATNLQDCTNLNANEIIQKWNDPNYIKELMNDYPFITEELLNEDVVMKLEGYLFPDTYNIFKETSIDDVTRIFLNNTNKYYEKYIDLFKTSRFSTNEIFTLASIIDYEGNTAEDRKVISSVFINRLDMGMPLQSSASRCYAISIHDNRNISSWSECELALDYDSPYDTYQHYGLTPGPIRCISETSLIAALEPADTNYLYFIADVCGDGTVYFSDNYATHNYYIGEYLSKCH